jgi:hypothetical protein
MARTSQRLRPLSHTPAGDTSYVGDRTARRGLHPDGLALLPDPKASPLENDMAFADAGGYELEPLAADTPGTVLRRYSAQVEDLYWSDNFWKQSYFRPDYDYEDYAPAFCVGYTGCAQYGGHFDDAEKSLCANFLRIRGDSRLTWDEALEPVRSAWNRVEQAQGQGLDMELSGLLERASEERSAA